MSEPIISRMASGERRPVSSRYTCWDWSATRHCRRGQPLTHLNGLACLQRLRPHCCPARLGIFRPPATPPPPGRSQCGVDLWRGSRNPSEATGLADRPRPTSAAAASASRSRRPCPATSHLSHPGAPTSRRAIPPPAVHVSQRLRPPWRYPDPSNPGVDGGRWLSCEPVRCRTGRDANQVCVWAGLVRPAALRPNRRMPVR